MPTILAPMRWATSISSGGVGLDQGVHAERLGEFQELAQGLLVEGRDDEQHQVGAVRAGLPNLVLVDVKSLRSTGMFTAARTASRSAREPLKRRCSVSTEIAAAPPAS